ncbi:MAG: hypothetical protein K5644_01985 [Lachnospiraceae bacterium]|nr:hypothetical protein [Lachnospiraceae bacterium]
MEYENARKGLNKLFFAVIFLIIGSIADALEFIPEVGLYVFSTLEVICALVNFILELVGLRQAGKDCPQIKTAFKFILLVLVLGFAGEVIIVFIPEYTWLREVTELIGFVVNLLVTYNVLYGCSVLKPELAEKAKKTWMVYMILIGVDLFSTIASIVLAGYGIFSVVYALYILFILFDFAFSVFAYIKYMKFLNIARKVM